MEPIRFPAPTASVRDILNFYRTEKIKNRQLAEHINRIQESDYDCSTRFTLCKALTSELQLREDQLTPLGSQICYAILQIPNTLDQVTIELRFLDQLTIAQIAEEFHCSTGTVNHRLRRAISKMQLTEYNK